MDIVKIDPQQYFCALIPDLNVKNATPGFTYLTAGVATFDGKSLSWQELESFSNAGGGELLQMFSPSEIVAWQLGDGRFSDQMLAQLHGLGCARSPFSPVGSDWTIRAANINSATHQLELRLGKESVDDVAPQEK